jgi:hypothetical protein
VDDIELRILALLDTLNEVERQASTLQEVAKQLRHDYLAKTAPERVCPNCTEYAANEGETFIPCKKDED